MAAATIIILAMLGGPKDNGITDYTFSLSFFNVQRRTYAPNIKLNSICKL